MLDREALDILRDETTSATPCKSFCLPRPEKQMISNTIDIGFGCDRSFKTLPPVTDPCWHAGQKIKSFG